MVKSLFFFQAPLPLRLLRVKAQMVCVGGDCLAVMHLRGPHGYRGWAPSTVGWDNGHPGPLRLVCHLMLACRRL